MARSESELPGVKKGSTRYIELFEVANIAGHNSELMSACRGGDHGILYKLVRFSIHASGPLTKCPRIHGQDFASARELVHSWPEAAPRERAC
jgi:hypothetical protein